MAVTIHQQPDNYSISGNPLVWVFSSNQTGQANFSFVIEVRINGVLTETHKVFPESGIRAHFDASDVAERNADTPTLADTYLYDANDYIETLNITIIESYGTPPVQIPDASADSSIVVVKGGQRKRDFISYDSSDYIFAPEKLWYTKFPRTEKRYIDLSNNNKFSFLTDSNNLLGAVELKNSSGGAIQTGNTVQAVRTEVSILNLNNTVLVNDYGLTQNNIDSASYLLFYLNDGADSSEELTLYIEDRCLASTSKHIIFMNTLGGLESYTFTKRSTESAKIKSYSIEKQFGYFDDSSDWDYSLGNNVDFKKTIDNELSLQTDYIAEDEYNWLVKELLSSPVIYLQEDGGLTPIKITDSKYTFKTSENDMIFKLKANFEREKDESTLV
jgi:hypothetical protein